MRSTTWGLLLGGLLFGGLLAWLDAGPPGGPTLKFPGLEGTAQAVPSELYWTDPSDPQPRRDREIIILPPRDGMRVGFEVRVDGRPLRTVSHRGKTYLPVPRLGIEYDIRVWNDGPRRVTALVSVDGLSVMDARPAADEKPGYIVAPRSDIVIKGWRRDRETVAAFSFEERDKSYASRSGHPEQIGVISLLAIEEKVTPPRLYERKEWPAAGRALPDVGDTGTGYGRDVDSPVYSVPFVRSNNQRRITVYYDTVSALRRAGVPVDDPSPLPIERAKSW